MPTSDDIQGQRSHCYQELVNASALTTALWGGTRAMREAGTVFLPMEPKETPLGYSNRLNRSILYNGYTKSVKNIAGKPFSKPVSTSPENLDEKIIALTKNADRCGNDLTQWAHKTFRTSIHFGMVHVLVDLPPLPVEGEKRSVKGERDNDIRPYFTQYDPLDLLFWVSEYTPDGNKKLIEVRLRERYVRVDGKAGERVRVLRPGAWEIYEHSAAGQETWVKSGEGTLSYDGGKSIPLFTFYTNGSDFLEATPTLEDLAWLNLAHWQSQSDQRNILRIARCGILFGAGVKEEDKKEWDSIGPNSLWSTENPDAKLGFVEHSGAAISAGRQDLVDLECKMEVLGFLPFSERSGDVTATSKAIDEGKGATDIQVWVNDFEAFIISLFKAAYLWINVKMPEDFKVDIFQEFTLSARAATDIVALNEMRRNKMITPETHLRECRKRGVLSEDLDIDKEIKALEEEDANDLELFKQSMPPVAAKEKATFTAADGSANEVVPPKNAALQA